MDGSLPTGYELKSGGSRDRSLLVKYMRYTYQELDPQQQNFTHLTDTVNRFFSPQTPLWLVKKVNQTGKSRTVGCLWLGNAIDQRTGISYAHILLIYVHPQHRHQGIGTALIQQAENWAKARGDRSLGLQVFTDNQPALSLYRRQGFQTQSLLMVKALS